MRKDSPGVDAEDGHPDCRRRNGADVFHAIGEHNVNEIASIIEQTAVRSQHSVEACRQLASLASELTGLVGAFKVG